MTTNEKEPLDVIQDVMNFMFWGNPTKPHKYQYKYHCDKCAEEHSYGFGLNE